MQRHIHRFCSSLRRIDDGLVVAQFAQRLVAIFVPQQSGERHEYAMQDHSEQREHDCRLSKGVHQGVSDVRMECHRLCSMVSPYP